MKTPGKITDKEIEEKCLREAEYLFGPTKMDQVAHAGFVDGFMKGADFALERSQEYGDEYLNAFIEWHNKKWGGLYELKDEHIQDFKESLKK